MVSSLFEGSFVFVAVGEGEESSSMVFSCLEVAVVALACCELEMSMTLENVIAKLSLIFELCGPQRSSPSLSTLVFSLEFVL